MLNTQFLRLSNRNVLYSAERVFGAVFGVPGVFGSGFTVVFGSVRQQTRVRLVLGRTRVLVFGKLSCVPYKT